MRKKPAGQLLDRFGCAPSAACCLITRDSAHQVEREFQVMSALAKVGFPVPRCHLLCTDMTVIGTAFFVMDFVRGRIFTDGNMPSLTPADREAVMRELARVLAQLHNIDLASVGLQNYGKPDKYFVR
jgi:aminoglycoside phosphotransferase (APT) family kinase protein